MFIAAELCAGWTQVLRLSFVAQRYLHRSRASIMPPMKRREFLTTLGAAGIVAASPITMSAQNPPAAGAKRTRIKQSVMASVWGQSNLAFEERCKVLAR